LLFFLLFDSCFASQNIFKETVELKGGCPKKKKN
jgi:hypothetical protein